MSFVYEVSEETNVIMCHRDCSCNIFMKNVAIFASIYKVCLKLKIFSLILLAEEIYKGPNIESVFVVITVSSNVDLQ